MTTQRWALRPHVQISTGSRSDPHQAMSEGQPHTNLPLVQEELRKPFCQGTKSKHFRFCKLHTASVVHAFVFISYEPSKRQSHAGLRGHTEISLAEFGPWAVSVLSPGPQRYGCSHGTDLSTSASHRLLLIPHNLTQMAPSA